MVVNFANLNCKESPTLVLRNLDGTPLQTLGYAFNVELDLAYNEVSTLTFSLPKYVDGEKTPHYDDVVGMRIVDLINCGQFILIDPQESDDGIRCVKECKAYSLEYEFAKKNIYLEAGTYNFFDGISTANPDTIIGRILERLPDWSADIDLDLTGKYRTFDDTNKKVYDFIKNDVQEKYGCIFEFDTYTRTVVVRNAYSEPNQNAVYLSQDALIKKIDLDEDSDSIVTCLDVYGGDGVDIRSVNPTGTNKIYNIDYFLNETNLSSDMIERWQAWADAVENARSGYYQITISYNMKLMEILAAEARLADLNTEMQILVNERATVIAAAAANTQGVRTLAQVNADIAAKQAEIDAQNGEITRLRGEANALDASRAATNAALALDNNSSAWHFTDEEILLLKRYFIEDTMEDSSFVQRNVITYDAVELSTAIPQGLEISIGGYSQQVGRSAIDTDGDGANDSYYIDFQSGDTAHPLGSATISFTSGGKTFSAEMVRGTLYCRSEGLGNNGSFVLSAYLGRGTVGSESFESGNLTITGRTSTPLQTIISANSVIQLSDDTGRLYFTENATEYERNQIEWELLEHATNVLREHASPTYNFSVEAVNFLALDDYIAFHNALELGERVYLNYDGEILTPYVVGVHMAFDDPASFKIEFSSSYTSFDKSFSLAKLLDQSVSMGKTLDYKSGVYSAFVSSGARSSVKTFMDSALDIAKNHVLSSGEQAITFDDTGIRLRKWSNDQHTAYDPEEIWMVNNMLVFTDNAWQDAKMAIGKIFDQNLIYKNTTDTSRVTGKTYYYRKADGTYAKWTTSISTWNTGLYEKTDGTAYGIAAQYIVGTMIAGQNLVIDAVDGQSRSYFKVDASGVYIDADRFLITHSGSGSGTNQSLADEIESIMSQVGLDGVITTYYQSAAPTENLVEGDLWYVDGNDIMSGSVVQYYGHRVYRWNGTAWELLDDPRIAEAVTAAGTAQATADGKIRTFYQATNPIPFSDNPTREYLSHSVGDLWYNTGSDVTGLKALTFRSGSLQEYTSSTLPEYVCASHKLYRWSTQQSSYTYYLWRPVEDGDVAAAITAANGKNKIYYQGSEPNSGMAKGDLWYDTDDGTVWVFSGAPSNTWVRVRDQDLVTRLGNVETKISSVITEQNNNTFLNADQIKGLISTEAAQMSNAAGSVLFDSEGMWMLSQTNNNNIVAADKEHATMAVWANAKGIMIGTGAAVGSGKSPATEWTWSTAISADGILADAIASGGTLSGVHVYGGDLSIGSRSLNIDGTSKPYARFRVDSNGNIKLGPYRYDESPDPDTHAYSLRYRLEAWNDGSLHIGSYEDNGIKYNFEVDPYGNVKANSGTFKGTISAESFLIGGNEALSNNRITAGFLELKGLEIKNSNDQTTFAIDQNGNVTMSGSISWSSVLKQYSEYQDREEGWHQPPKLSSDKFYRYSYDGGNTWSEGVAIVVGGDAQLPSYIKETYIDSTTVMSPTITGGTVKGGVFISTGDGASNTDSAYYVGYINSSNEYKKLGYFSYDDDGTGNNSRFRVRLVSHGHYTLGGVYKGIPIKIESTGDISIQAGTLNGRSIPSNPSQYTLPADYKGIIYMSSQTNFSSSIVLADGVTYGSSLPLSGMVTGQLFFKIS